MGWTWTPVKTGTTGSFVRARATIRTRSWNWVARNVVQGTPELARTCSAPRLEA